MSQFSSRWLSRARVSDELYAAIAEAQARTQQAHNLAYEENASAWLCMALGRAQNILITWQARLPNRPDWRAGDGR